MGVGLAVGVEAGEVGLGATLGELAGGVADLEERGLLPAGEPQAPTRTRAMTNVAARKTDMANLSLGCSADRPQVPSAA